MKSVILATLVALASASAVACPGNPDCQNGQCKLKKHDLATSLGLEGEKAQAVKALQAQYKADREALKGEMHALSEGYKSELAKLLTEDEYAKVEAMISRHGEHGGHSQGGYHDSDKGGDKPRQCDHDKGEHKHH